MYIFGKGREINVVYVESSLSEEAKKEGTYVKDIPPLIEKEGYEPVLVLTDDNKLIWEYQIIEQPSDDNVV